MKTIPVFTHTYRDALAGLEELRGYWHALNVHATTPHRKTIRDLTYYGYGRGFNMDRGTLEAAAEYHEQDVESARRDAIEQRSNIDASLEVTVPYYVGHEIGKMLASAAETLPETTFTHEMLPSLCGLLWFDGDGLDLEARQSDWERSKWAFDLDVINKGAIWANMNPAEKQRILQMLDEDGKLRTRPTLQAMMWHPLVAQYDGDNLATLNIVVAFYFRHHFPPNYPVPVRTINYEFGIAIRFGEAPNDPDTAQLARESNLQGSLWLCNMFLTALLFMKQKYVDETEHRVTERHIVKEYESKRQSKPPAIRVITLRKRDNKHASADESASAVEYSCNWLVDSHWHQYRVGPGKKQLSPRYVFQYPKGDPNKPFRPKPKTVGNVIR